MFKALFISILLTINIHAAFAQLSPDSVRFRFGVCLSYSKPITDNNYLPAPPSTYPSRVGKAYWHFALELKMQKRLNDILYLNLGLNNRMTEYSAYKTDTRFSNIGLTAYYLQKIKIQTTGVSVGLSPHFRFRKFMIAPSIQTNMFALIIVRNEIIYPKPTQSKPVETTNYIKKPFSGNFRLALDVSYTWNRYFETSVFIGDNYQALKPETYIPEIYFTLEYGIGIALTLGKKPENK